MRLVSVCLLLHRRCPEAAEWIHTYKEEDLPRNIDSDLKDLEAFMLSRVWPETWIHRTY